MNNLECRTLIEGLGTVIQLYGNAEGYRWQPVTTDPAYLKLMKPDIDFVALAKAFGVNHGTHVREPRDVKAALEAGVDHVLNNRTPFIVELFTDPAPIPDQPQMAARIAAAGARGPVQPPIDIFFHEERSHRQ